MGRWTLGVTAPASNRLTVDFPTAEQPLTIKTGAGTFRRLDAAVAAWSYARGPPVRGSGCERS
jgi:hypothetical protein